MRERETEIERGREAEWERVCKREGACEREREHLKKKTARVRD